MSAKRIVQPVIFDNLKNAIPGGLYDSAMGPVDTRGRCVCVLTCVPPCIVVLILPQFGAVQLY